MESRSQPEEHVESRLRRWLAAQVWLDARARLVEAGAGGDARIELASIFVDLLATNRGGREGIPIAKSLCVPDDSLFFEASERHTKRGVLLVGGPGTGKSTATAMAAQLLRLGWIDPELPPGLLSGPTTDLQKSLPRLRACAVNLGVPKPKDTLPFRINLPVLADWLSLQSTDSSPDDQLWSFLSWRVSEDTRRVGSCSMSAEELKELAGSHPITWIFDALDEVPRSAGRAKVVSIVHEVLSMSSRGLVVVTTRPESYEGEFRELASWRLSDLTEQSASDYAQRLLGAWLGQDDSKLQERLASLRTDFQRSEIKDLAKTPLHVTMMTLLAATGSMPKSRWLLQEEYFNAIFKREVDRGVAKGIRAEHKSIVRSLHDRVGLVLQVRAQHSGSARASLRRREIASLLRSIYSELEYDAETATELMAQILNFSRDRLVLLVRGAEDGYAFGIRSLQEFFAASALRNGTPEQVRARALAVCLSPHWHNVLLFLASEAALRVAPGEKEAALAPTVDVCKSLNAGVRGEPAKRGQLGSRLAFEMLKETRSYGHPRLHNGLWDVVLEDEGRVSWGGFGSTSREPHPLTTDELLYHVGHFSTEWPESVIARVRDRAEALLSSGQEAGWKLMSGLLMKDDQAARQIATRYAPRDRAAAQRMSAALVGPRRSAFAGWLVEFWVSHIDWISPGWLCQKSLRSGLGLPSAPVLFPAWIVGRLYGISKGVLKIELVKGLEILLRSIQAGRSDWASCQKMEGANSPDWVAWNAVVEFQASPSKASLAKALRSLSTAETFAGANALRFVLSWPLLGCLESVSEARELLPLAGRVEAGQLGDYADWVAAELRWEKGVSEEEFMASASTPLWTHEIARTGVAVVLSPVVGSFRGDAKSMSLLERWCQIISGRTRAGLGFSLFCFRAVDRAPPLHLVETYVENLRKGWRAPLYLATVPQLSDLSEAKARQVWLTAMDEAGRRDLVVYGENSRLDRVLLHSIPQHPEMWGLRVALLVHLQSQPDLELRLDTLGELPEEAPPRALGAQAALEILFEPLDLAKPPELRRLFGSDEHGRFDFRFGVANILGRRATTERSIEILCRLLDACAPNDEARDALSDALRALAIAGRPPFSNSGDWETSGFGFLLPLPPRSDSASVHISEITELSNLRLFKSTPKIHAPLPRSEQGQWIVLLGENGSGKTTFLRALALVLAGPSVGTKLLGGPPMIRNGGEGRIRLKLDSTPLEVTIRLRDRIEVVEGEEVPTGSKSAQEGFERPWVVGYGVRRGGARGEKDRTVVWGPMGELHTLFDHPAALVNGVEWLQKRYWLRIQEKEVGSTGTTDPGFYAATYSAVERVLKRLLRLKSITFVGENVIVDHQTFGECRLDSLSDGYLTTAGWIVDLMARWIERQRELDEPVSEDFPDRMTGIVLIDEIDLHLHPWWQMEIIADIRQLFPRLSFVVTTHNPLTLQGAKAGEVFIMRRAGDQIELDQRDVQAGWDVDRILLDHFGIFHTFDQETRAWLSLHRGLLERGVSSDDPARLELEAKIEGRLGRASLRVFRGSEGSEDLRLRPEDLADWKATKKS